MNAPFRKIPALVTFAALSSAAAWATAQGAAAPKTPTPAAATAPAKAVSPRLKEPRVTLLPNGWRISPVGQHFTVGDLPMNLVVTPDGDHVIVTNNGYSQPNLVVYDYTKQISRDRVMLESAWLGLAFHPDGKHLFSSGRDQLVKIWQLEDGKLVREFGKFVDRGFWITSLSISPDGRLLAAADDSTRQVLIYSLLK